MPRGLNPRQLTGLDDSHLVMLPDGHRLQAEVADAFAVLQQDARDAGFELAIASSFRSFERQLAIWNGKASGERPVYDEEDRPISLAGLQPTERLYAILRFSALPGASRHHWGTDLDVYDASAVPGDYEVQLSLAEVGVGGPFDALHSWLDARMDAGDSRGFYRPYASDRGGVAPERWHLSYAPVSVSCAAGLHADTLLAGWDDADAGELLLRGEIEPALTDIMRRFVNVPGDWCPVNPKR
jgi:LAS superfamily LD-carboxypeptidase LdcB